MFRAAGRRESEGVGEGTAKRSEEPRRGACNASRDAGNIAERAPTRKGSFDRLLTFFDFGPSFFDFFTSPYCDHGSPEGKFTTNSRAHEGNSPCSSRNLTQNLISRSLLNGIDCGLIFWKGIDTLLHLSTGFMWWKRLYPGEFFEKHK